MCTTLTLTVLVYLLDCIHQLCLVLSTNQAYFVPSKTIKSYMKTQELRNENLLTWKAKITKKQTLMQQSY